MPSFVVFNDPTLTMWKIISIFPRFSYAWLFLWEKEAERGIRVSSIMIWVTIIDYWHDYQQKNRQISQFLQICNVTSSVNVFYTTLLRTPNNYFYRTNKVIKPMIIVIIHQVKRNKCNENSLFFLYKSKNIHDSFIFLLILFPHCQVSTKDVSTVHLCIKDCPGFLE